ncbi:DNA/RNA non-specific endonuclease [Streptomyces sp. CBMA156]|uniref:DNA/RNA non-specific endonuclease n=1 Tax=Streptomyces sp. CBMA156 TaxID=1930280 RepID=UPI001661C00A|nr:DNA/RNA non-specific endonuclease [Streptomyces sp. CBMA156]
MSVAVLAAAVAVVPAAPQASAAGRTPVPTLYSCPDFYGPLPHPLPPDGYFEDQTHRLRWEIDAEGRPTSASFVGQPRTRDLPGTPSVNYQSARRPTYAPCQRFVGGLPRDANVAQPPMGATWDGGHLIAYVLFGADGRYNLVPQTSKVNRGVFSTFENVAAWCLRPDMKNPAKPGQVNKFSVHVNYFPTPQGGTPSVFPESFDVEVDVTGAMGPYGAAGRIPWDYPERPTVPATLTADLQNVRRDSEC